MNEDEEGMTYEVALTQEEEDMMDDQGECQTCPMCGCPGME